MVWPRFIQSGARKWPRRPPSGNWATSRIAEPSGRLAYT